MAVYLYDAETYDDEPSRKGFTKRESQILAEMAEGNTSTKGIAKELNMKPGTVQQHLRHLFDKLRIRKRSRTVLALYAAKELKKDDGTFLIGK